MLTEICKGNSKEISNGGIQVDEHANESKEKLCKEDGAKKVDKGYYRTLIGCLMYLTAIKPDILFVVSLYLVL